MHRPRPEPGWADRRPPLDSVDEAAHEAVEQLASLDAADCRPLSVLAAMELAAKARALAAAADAYAIAVVTTPRPGPVVEADYVLVSTDAEEADHV